MKTYAAHDRVEWPIVKMKELAVKTPMFARSTSKFPTVESKSTIKNIRRH